MVSPRQQPTVATPRSSPAALVFAAVAALVVVWGAGKFWFEFKRSRAQAQVAAEAARASAPAAAPSVPITPVPIAPVPAPPPPPTLAAAPGIEPNHSPAAATAGTPTQAAGKAPPETLDACRTAVASAGIRLPSDMEVLATGAYEGRRTSVPYDRQPGHAIGQFDVTVDRPGKPVALMLGAYEPTNWNVTLLSGTRLVAVYVGGYHAPTLNGLPGGVPVIFGSYDLHSPCPYFYLGGEGISRVDLAARRVFGRSVDRYIPAGRDGSVYIGGAP